MPAIRCSTGRPSSLENTPGCHFTDGTEREIRGFALGNQVRMPDFGASKANHRSAHHRRSKTRLRYSRHCSNSSGIGNDRSGALQRGGTIQTMPARLGRARFAYSGNRTRFRVADAPTNEPNDSKGSHRAGRWRPTNDVRMMPATPSCPVRPSMRRLYPVRLAAPPAIGWLARLRCCLAGKTQDRSLPRS
jgi:hypothetical protein